MKGVDFFFDQLDQLDRLRPPASGHTATDLDRIAGLPPHTELVDGSLIFAARQTNFHGLAKTVLAEGLRARAPSDYRVRSDMTVTLNDRQRPEPDVIVVNATADHGMGQTMYKASDVVLAVEVETEESHLRDRKRKPQIYAEARIAHFWRVEEFENQAVVYVHKLDDDATDSYILAGVYRGQLKVDMPFEVNIDLTKIERM